MKTLKKLLPLVALAGMIAGWFSLSESTRRYLIHLGKQVPSLPYRYFV